MDSPYMRDYIRNFTLNNGPRGNQGYSRVLLQLFGYPGHGKSSFINSCKYVMDDGPYNVYAKVAVSEENPETMIRYAYKLTETITLVDNRGCAKMNKDETGEIYAQLGNFLPLDTKVTWHTEYKDMMEILLKTETQEENVDLIVPVFIYSAKKPIDPEENLGEIMLKAKQITDVSDMDNSFHDFFALLVNAPMDPQEPINPGSGLFPTVVITRKLSEHLPDLQEKFRRMGVENIFPVENYTKEDHRRTRGKHEGILKCLYEIIKDVAFKMEETRNPSAEKIERKRILYEFAHKRDLEKAQKRESRERARREELEKKLERKKGFFGLFEK